MRRAEQAAQTAGPHLGLGARGFHVRWRGQSGMKWSNLRPAFQLMLLAGGVPDFMILHLGGNDIVQKEICQMKLQILADINFMAEVLPKTRFVWFDIIPRLQWRGASVEQNKKLDLKRKRVNRFGRQQGSRWASPLAQEN